MFPTLSIIPVQDFMVLNNYRIKTNRNDKYLLLNNRGVIMEYTSNCLKTWLKYIKEYFKKKKNVDL